MVAIWWGRLDWGCWLRFGSWNSGHESHKGLVEFFEAFRSILQQLLEVSRFFPGDHLWGLRQTWATRPLWERSHHQNWWGSTSRRDQGPGRAKCVQWVFWCKPGKNRPTVFMIFHDVQVYWYFTDTFPPTAMQHIFLVATPCCVQVETIFGKNFRDGVLLTIKRESWSIQKWTASWTNTCTR